MRQKHKGLQVRSLWFFVAEKRLQRPGIGLLQLFCCDRLRVDSPFCTDCPDGHGPQTN